MDRDEFMDTDKKSRMKRIRNIIMAKVPWISKRNMDSVMDSIDLSRQYTITGTSDLFTLLKNSYEEYSKEFDVSISRIYGRLKTGCIRDGSVVIHSSARDEPIAFTKHVKIMKNSLVFNQYILFLYQPLRTKDSSEPAKYVSMNDLQLNRR